MHFDLYFFARESGNRHASQRTTKQATATGGACHAVVVTYPLNTATNSVEGRFVL